MEVVTIDKKIRDLEIREFRRKLKFSKKKNTVPSLNFEESKN